MKKLLTKMMFWVVGFPVTLLAVLVALLLMLLATAVTAAFQLAQAPFKLLSRAATIFLRALVEQKKKDVNIVFTVSGEKRK